MKNLLPTLLRTPLAWLALSLAACGGGSGPDNSGGAPTFAKSYGGPARDQATAAVPRPGGGYAFAGTLNNRGSGSGRISGLFGDGREGDLWVTALDAFGDVQWQRSYGRAPVVPTGLPASGPHDGVEYLRLRAALDAENDGLRNGAWLVGRLSVLEPNEGAGRAGYTERGTDLVITRLDANNQVLFSRAYDSGPFPGVLPYFFSGEQTSEVVGGVDIWPTADGGAIALADASATLSEDGRAVTRGAIYLVKVDAAGDRQASAVFPLDDGRATRRLHVRAAAGGAVAAYNFGDGMQVTRFDVSTGSVTVRWRRNFEGGEWPFDLLA
ncbi:MAG TPA: hypothetical protein VLJ62_27540, partial [Burkholderiaceae bacterium]|nr:hypothetical protein [Burkholderiaceae bacterium]